MKSVWTFTLEHILLFEACLLQYNAFVNAGAEPSSNLSSTPLVPTPDLPPTLSDCGNPTCSIIISPTILSYPDPVKESTQEVTATIIPIVYTYPDGRRSTTRSTYKIYNPTSNLTWSPPETSLLTWETLGTTFTYPTTYIAYPSPNLILNLPTTASDKPSPARGCSQTLADIPIPPSLTKSLIFTYNKDDGPTPSVSVIWSILDNLPTVTALIGGGNPRTCFHGTPSRTAFATVVPPFGPVLHTTVSVLTTVGEQVTLAANPFDDGGAGPSSGPGPGPSPRPGTGGGSGTSPQGQNQGSDSPSSGSGSGGGSNPSPITIGGQIITPAPSGGILLDGSTLLPGSAGTIGNGVPISVASTGGVVVIGGSSTITLPSRTRPSTSTPSRSGVGAAVASGIGATRNYSFQTSKFGVLALEASVLAILLGALGIL